MAHFAVNAAATVMFAAGWFAGGTWKTLAALAIVASGVDGAIDLVPFTMGGHLLAAVTEAAWVVAGIIAARHLAREFVPWAKAYRNTFLRPRSS